MGYRLGIDLGTTFTAAAVVRPGAAPEVVPLGNRAAAVPTVLFLGADGALLVGEAAERRAVTDPDRVVRQFKRRIGDETPLVVGNGTDATEHLAHNLAAALIWWVAARVTEREGAPPEAIAVTHPATWGPHKKDLMRAALAAKGLSSVTLVTEPEAVAISYAATGRIPANATLAVYDLGGGTFDAALLRTTPDGRFTALGRPHGLPDLGGIDFDDAILAHVLGSLDPGVSALATPGLAPLAESGFLRVPDMTDPLTVTAMARLRRECVDAKEALSSDTTATIPVLLGDVRTNIRLTRGELEAMITPAVLRTLGVLDATLASADVDPGDLTNVLLTGGSSRIPIVAQLLSGHLGAPVSLDRDIDPKLAVAIGGALALAGRVTAAMLPPVKAAEVAVRATVPPAPDPTSAPVPVAKSAVTPAAKTVSVPVIKAKATVKPKVTVKATAPGSAAAAAAAVSAAGAAAVNVAATPAAATAVSAAAPTTAAPTPPTSTLPAPLPARPASTTAYLAGVDDVALPPAKSRLGARRAFTLLGLSTVLMLGSGVGLNALVGSGEQTRQTTSVAPVETAVDETPVVETKAEAKAKKKKAKSEASASAAGTASATPSAATSESTAGSAARTPADTTTATRTGSATTTTAEQAAAKRKAAAKKRSGKTTTTERERSSYGTGSDPAAWDASEQEAPQPADSGSGSAPSTPTDPGSGSAPSTPTDSGSAPSTPTDPGTGTGSGSGDTGGSTPAEPSGDTGSDAPVGATGEPDKPSNGGFTRTAPPEAP